MAMIVVSLELFWKALMLTVLLFCQAHFNREPLLLKNGWFV